MDELSSIEFETLRLTIASRGTARLVLFLTGVGLWAVALLAILIALPNPIASIVPLILLLATFEAARMSSAGVERIGRYLQVFYERPALDQAPLVTPAWEHTAMRLGPRVPGTGGHPLFLPFLSLATVVNFLAVLLPGPVPAELTGAGIVHLAFIAWMLYVDRGMRRQRAHELERFMEMKRGR